jgi:ankyrin repeat protein
MKKFRISSLLLGTFLMPVVSYGSADFDEADAQFAGTVVSDEALFEAIKANDSAKVRYLLDHGANVNAHRVNTDKYWNFEETPLTEAIMMGNIDIVRLLLDLRADPNVHLKTTSNDPYKKWYYSYSTPLSRATAKQDIDIIRLLLDRGADANARREYVEQGMTNGTLFTRYSCPLVDAIAKDDIEIVRLLLERGANVNTEGGATLVPLIEASDTQNVDMVSLLLEQRGIDVNATHNIDLTWDEYEAIGYGGGTYEDLNRQEPTTALRSAKGNDRIIRLLLAHGAHW